MEKNTLQYESNLLFVKNLLARMKIHSHTSDYASHSISTDIDMGLRAMLFDLDDYISYLKNSMNDAADNTVYCFYDEYNCKYIFFRLPNSTHFFFIGPYLISTPSESDVYKTIEHLDLAEEKKKMAYKFYASLPIVENEEFLITIINTLAESIWGTDNYHLEYIDYMITDRTEPFAYTKQPDRKMDDSPYNLAMIERIYENENIMMNAVKKGKLHSLTTILSYNANNNIEHRSQDSLKNRKDYLVILKTLLRKAAEYGNVHPFHIDRESTRYAEIIDAALSIKECEQIQQSMIKDFCLLVHNHSLNRYSPLIGRVITLISFDLTADLQLKTLAKQLNVHPNYLSAQFHKECGYSLTEFVNRKRIELAINKLESKEKQIQIIASECGIPDINYFIRLFKRYTGLTPTQYRNQRI